MLYKQIRIPPKKLINFHVDPQTICDVEKLLSYCQPSEGITKADIYRSALRIGLDEELAYEEKIKKHDKINQNLAAGHVIG